jgi:hypothetical protein
VVPTKSFPTSFSSSTASLTADPSDSAVWSLAPRPLACWCCGFESHLEYACLSLVSVVCCQVEVSASDWSLVQGSPIECGVYIWVWSWSPVSVGPDGLGRSATGKKKLVNYYLFFICSVSINLKNYLLWNVSPCSLIEILQRFGRTHSLRFHFCPEGGGNSSLQTVGKFYWLLGVRTQKTVAFVVISVRTANLTFCKYLSFLLLHCHPVACNVLQHNQMLQCILWFPHLPCLITFVPVFTFCGNSASHHHSGHYRTTPIVHNVVT